MMTANPIPLHPAPVEPSKFERLYDAWRYAKAQRDVADYAPDSDTNLSSEELEALCNRTSAALNEMLLCPAYTIGEIAIKLRVFQEEEVIGGWTRAPEIVARLVADASYLAKGE